MRDMLVEIWQANAAGRYNHPADRQDDKPIDQGFRGWGRTGTDFQTGVYSFETVKPGPVAGRTGASRWRRTSTCGIVGSRHQHRASTRMYFADEAAANAEDPVLNMIEPAVRRETLIAQREDRGGRSFTFSTSAFRANAKPSFSISDAGEGRSQPGEPLMGDTP